MVKLLISKNKYRPIALASIMSKLLEKIIYHRIFDTLVTSCNQYGFKSKHSKGPFKCYVTPGGGVTHRYVALQGGEGVLVLVLRNACIYFTR